MNRLIREGLSWPAVCALVAAGLVLLTACGGGGEREATTDGAGQADAVAAQGEEIPTVEVQTRWAYGNANDLQSLIGSSDEVFVGSVTRVLGQSEGEQAPRMNNGRRGLPLTSFEVTVKSAQIGSLTPGDTVVIEQAGGITEVSGGSRVSIVLEGDKLLENGAEYLFFADRKANGNLTVPPFGRLQVGGDGSLEPLAAWSRLGALRQLSGLSASGAAARIGQAQ